MRLEQMTYMAKVQAECRHTVEKYLDEAVEPGSVCMLGRIAKEFSRFEYENTFANFKRDAPAVAAAAAAEYVSNIEDNHYKESEEAGRAAEVLISALAFRSEIERPKGDDSDLCFLTELIFAIRKGYAEKKLDPEASVIEFLEARKKSKEPHE